MKVYPKVIRLDGFTFPRIGSHLNWKLRYARDQITESDMLEAASIISAYDSLVVKTQKSRNAICKVLLKNPIIERE